MSTSEAPPAEQKEFLEPLLALLSKGDLIYRQYMENGREYRHALVIFENNSRISDLLSAWTDRLPEDLRLHSEALRAHLGAWTEQWLQLDGERRFGPHDAFVFQSRVAFPRASADALRRAAAALYAVDARDQVTARNSVSKDSPILFLGKEGDAHCEKAAQFVSKHFGHALVRMGSWGAPMPPELEAWQGGIIISYLSRWVVPKAALERAELAINFHPGTPDYPGIGCINFALYEDAPLYGATCHHMQPKVDTGAIIAVRRFDVFPSDSVATLLARTYDFQLTLFYDVMSHYIRKGSVPASDETWTRKAFTRKEFNALFTIDPSMPAEEVRRRVRACSFNQFQPHVKLGDYSFELRPS
jgi:hypothetical protein